MDTLIHSSSAPVAVFVSFVSASFVTNPMLIGSGIE